MNKLDQTKRPLFDTLVDYSNSKVVAFDVPGHKMGLGIHQDFIDVVGSEIFKMDVNSSKKLDLLSNPTGVIGHAEELAADCYGADNAFFIVNGSTSGVQSMILATCKEGDKIIIPRNVHKSAINGLVLSGAKPIYLKPYTDSKLGISMGVSFDEVKNVIDENLDAKAILLVYPTYFGVSSNLKEIIEYAHSKNIIVLVDESWGSHFGFSDNYSMNSMRLGADIATISMHKSGGSLTQSSILLHNNGLVKRDSVRSVINLTQTSSASYLLLSSLDLARHNLAMNGKELLNKMYDLSIYAREKINEIDGLICMGKDYINGDSIYDLDFSKLVIDVTNLGLTGFKVYDILREDYNIQIELGETKVILAVVSIGDEKHLIDKLVDALKDISARFRVKKENIKINFKYNIPEMVLTPREAFFSNTRLEDIDKCVGEISGDSLMIYPPGIPLVNPGEKITQEIIDDFKFFNEELNVVLGSKTIENNIKIKIVDRS